MVGYGTKRADLIVFRIDVRELSKILTALSVWIACTGDAGMLIRFWIGQGDEHVEITIPIYSGQTGLGSTPRFHQPCNAASPVAKSIA